MKPDNRNVTGAGHENSWQQVDNSPCFREPPKLFNVVLILLKKKALSAKPSAWDRSNALKNCFGPRRLAVRRTIATRCYEKQVCSGGNSRHRLFFLTHQCAKFSLRVVRLICRHATVQKVGGLAFTRVFPMFPGVPKPGGELCPMVSDATRSHTAFVVRFFDAADCALCQSDAR